MSEANQKDTTRIIERVKKLLAVAQDNPSQGEAENAMLKAQELLALHRMTMEDVEQKPQGVERVTVYAASRSARWREILGVAIADNFRCFCYLSRSSRRCLSQIMFAGYPEDVDVARAVFQFACAVAAGLTKERKLVAAAAEKNNFLNGFAEGVWNALESQKETKAEEWGLVLVLDPELAQARDDMKSAKVRRKEPDKDSSYAQGFFEGLKFDPNTAGSVLA